MLVKLICSVSSNQSHGEYPDCRSERESGGEASLLVSPLVVAGIVIGLVLFLSCITIIIGSLRKDSQIRNPHFDASYGQDGFSFGGSAGELRSSCIEDFPPALDFDSFRESLPQITSLFPDSPPRYNECVGPDLSQIYIPTDDPPPYSLLDPCWSPAGSEEQPPHSGPPDASQYCGETSASTAWSSSSSSASSHCSLGLHEREQQHIACISFPMEATPPYDAVLGKQGQPLPLMTRNLNKHSDRDYDENSQQLPANHISQDR